MILLNHFRTDVNNKWNFYLRLWTAKNDFIYQRSVTNDSDRGHAHM